MTLAVDWAVKLQHKQTNKWHPWHLEWTKLIDKAIKTENLRSCCILSSSLLTSKHSDRIVYPCWKDDDKDKYNARFDSLSYHNRVQIYLNVWVQVKSRERDQPFLTTDPNLETIFPVSSSWRSYEPRHEKTCVCHMRTTNAHINLRIRAVWSAPLLFECTIYMYILANSKMSRL